MGIKSTNFLCREKNDEFFINDTVYKFGNINIKY